eukprot:4112069-Prymnesium_polylepis.1
MSPAREHQATSVICAQPAQVADSAPAQGRPREGHQQTAGAYKQARRATAHGRGRGTHIIGGRLVLRM